MMDHWFQMEGFATAQDPMLEGYTVARLRCGENRADDPRRSW